MAQKRNKKKQSNYVEIIRITILALTAILGLINTGELVLESNDIARIKNVLNHNVVCVEENAPTHCEVK